MAPPRPSFRELVRVFLRIGLLSFGGPAGQIALMHKELVEERRWISDARFIHALSYCMLLPGPEAQQLATYIGWLLHRTPGAIVAGGLFVLPGFFVVLVLSAVYAAFHRVPIVDGALHGLKAAVIAIVIEALVRVGRRALRGSFAIGVAVCAFVALAVFAVPFPIVVVVAAIAGLAFGPRRPAPADDETAENEPTSVVDEMLARGELAHATPSMARALRALVVFAVLWLTPLALVRASFGAKSVFVEEGLFFAKTSLVTFGGAYAALAYVAQQAVDTYAWLSAGEMVDGLGLAETTPGPLMLVLEFVGYVAAHRAHGDLPPAAAGILGATLTVWMTFVPCFFFVLVGAPWIERPRKSATLARALGAVTAAVVGVIANLAFFFAVHALFGRVDVQAIGPIHVTYPVPATIDWLEAGLAAVAMVCVLRFHVSVPKLVAAFAVVGAAVHLLRN
jgi:chromate transporter